MASVTALGLGKTMEKKLHTVGIHSAEELTEMGSRQAYLNKMTGTESEERNALFLWNAA